MKLRDNMGTLTPGATYIYESPDGGQTVYARESGTNQRHLVGYSEGAKDLDEHKLWNEIRMASRTNPALRKQVERVILIYQTIKDHE
jgi:HD superfamily phosphodiesterase